MPFRFLSDIPFLRVGYLIFSSSARRLIALGWAHRTGQDRTGRARIEWQHKRWVDPLVSHLQGWTFLHISCFAFAGQGLAAFISDLGWDMDLLCFAFRFYQRLFLSERSLHLDRETSGSGRASSSINLEHLDFNLCLRRHVSALLVSCCVSAPLV